MQEILDKVGGCVKKYKVKSGNMTSHGIDLILEVKNPKEEELLKGISVISGTTNVALLDQTGERRF